MRTIIWLFGIVIAGLLQAQPAPQAKIAFKRGYYAFEEIARQLSVEGCTVVCEPSLRQRMALLSLKPRPWHEVKHLLEQGLDLEIVCISKEQDRWLLRRHKEVVQQEKKRLDQLAQVLEKRLTGKTPQRYPNWSAILRSLPSDIKEEDLHALQEWRSQMEEFLKDSADEEEEPTALPQLLGHRLERFGQMPSSLVLVRWARSQAKLPKEEFLYRFGAYFGEYMFSLSEEARTRYILLALSEGLLHRGEILLVDHLHSLLQRGKVVRQLLEQGLIVRQTPLPAEVGTLLSESGREHQSMSQVVGVLVYQSKPKIKSIRLTRTPYVLDTADGTLKLLPDDNGVVSIDIDSDSLTALFKEMDAQLHTEYLQATQEHRVLTQHPAYQTPVLLAETSAEMQGKQRPDFFVLYPWLARFADQLGQEVIVEMYPQRVPYWVSKEALSLSQMVSLLEKDGNGAWRVERIEGVWVWRNWLAFLDRVPDYPLVAIRQLVHSGKRFSDYLQFYRQVSLAQARQMLLTSESVDCAHLFSVTERVGSLRSLGETWLVVALLGRISGWEQLIPSSDESEIPLNRLPMPPSLLQEWVSLLIQTNGIGADVAVQSFIWLGRSGELVDWLSREGILRIKVRDKQSFWLDVMIGGNSLAGGLFYFPLHSRRSDDR